MRMIFWMCGVGLGGGRAGAELGERVGVVAVSGVLGGGGPGCFCHVECGARD